MSRPSKERTKTFSPFGQLVLARLREFFREPATIFWVYGFPILMVVALGIAFRNRPVEKLQIDVLEGPLAEAVFQALSKRGEENGIKLQVKLSSQKEGRQRLRTAKTDLLVASTMQKGREAYRFIYDPYRLEGKLSRSLVNEILQSNGGQKCGGALVLKDRYASEPGSRYIDFLVPGLLGMSLMGGGLWGVGYVIVDMRIRKLLKRLISTPMKRSHFLGGIIISRLLFMVPEVIILLIFARLFFDVHVFGSLWQVLLLVVLGAFTFAGIGLLVASRARTLETASGLMNLVMLPMWALSGIFFSAERFPQAAQPFIQALPLTALNDALRAVMLEGQSMFAHLSELALLALWGVGTFVLALRWFRWT